MSSLALLLAVVVGGLVFGGVILRIVGGFMVAAGLFAAMTSSQALSSRQRTLLIAGGVVAWLLGHCHFSLLYRASVRDGNRLATVRPYKSSVAGLVLDLLADGGRLLAQAARRPAVALGRFVLQTSHRQPASTVALPPPGPVDVREANPSAAEPAPVAGRQLRRRRGDH